MAAKEDIELIIRRFDDLAAMTILRDRRLGALESAPRPPQAP